MALAAAGATLATTLLVPASLPTASADPGGSRAGGQRVGPDSRDHRPRQRAPQTSDGVRGDVAAYVPRALRKPPVVSNELTWLVSPGVTYRQWDQTDARGPIRAYLLTVDPAPGVAIDYAGSKSVRNRDTVRRLIRRDAGAVAAVNGDFFDIGDTGAALGVGVDRQRGLLHAPKYGWNRAFVVKDGHPDIVSTRMRAKVVQAPWLPITNYNSPTVKIGKVGIYDHRWGMSAGYRVVDGQRYDVRQVVIRRNRVVENSAGLSSGKPIRGVMLVGRGPGANALKALRVGTRARVSWHLRGRPDVAITGNKVLLRNGVRRVVDDVELHPRTAVGIDRDTGQVLLLVVDGRQSFSRGYTMVELANLMTTLGAEDALNLDGGGSSTMLGLGPDAILDVLNSPSDGVERKVANGLVVTYTPPAAR